MTAGGFEPPRQLPASSCQDYCGCLLHHAAKIENQGEGSLPDRPSPKSPYIRQYHNLCYLSIGKTIIDAHNTILEGRRDMS